MSEENKNITKEEKETSFDFKKIWFDLLKHKKLFYKVLPIAFVLAAIYALSLPNYYNCTVKLSPELSTSSRGSSGLAALASNFGLNLGRSSGTAGMGTEALFPTLYPDLMNSTDFKTSLFPVMITLEPKTKGDSIRHMTYYDYLKTEQKSPWWSSVVGAPKKFIGFITSLFKEKKEEEAEKPFDPFRLTKEQTAIAKAINGKVVCEVDKKTMVITISVTDQNPLVCATIADSVKTRLQDFITDYRTSKVRVDLEYNKKIFAETKERYEEARQRYSEYMDANHNIILYTQRQKQTDLENELQLQYNAYLQVASALQAAEAKVQEETPAFTTLQRATVPIVKAGPSRAKICLIWLFLAFLGTTVYVLYKEGDLKSLLGMGENGQDED
ncbi:MAG: chain-length determining protein [Prevotella sp.]|nr:chain-length determining protein [Prevotella sp.]